jgi:glycosyltransferase involved in cell wall biosynthesis
MKIAFLIHSFSAGGAEKQFIMLSRKLSEKGYENLFILYKNNKPFYDVKNITIKYVPKIHKIDLSFLFSLVKLVKKEKIDILFSCYEGHFEAPMLWARLVKIFNPAVKIISGYRALRHNKSLLLIERITNGLSDLIISNNPNTEDLLVKKAHIKKAKIRFIPNILDKTNFKVISPDKIKSFRSHYFPNNENRFICGIIARYSPQKNHQQVVKGAKILKTQGELDKFYFSFYGDKNSYKSQYNILQSLINKYGLGKNIELNGTLKNVNNFINACDVIILPSLYEGFSNVVTEAIMCQKPVIISINANGAGLVKDGINGLVYNTNNHEELADCIIKLENPPIIIDKKYVNNFLEKYSVDKVVDNYIEEFKSLFI